MYLCARHFWMISLSILPMKSSSSSSPVFFFLLLLPFAATFIFASGEVIFKDGLKDSIVLRLPSGEGPESFAFDCNGDGPYTGVSDGRVLKWQRIQKKWVEFAVTSPNRNRKLCDGSTDPNNEPACGRPLGLDFDMKTCNLYIADAYFGLLRVGPSGGVAKQLAISASDGGAPFKFLNGLDVDQQTGVVYFSESSTVYQRRYFSLSSCHQNLTSGMYMFKKFSFPIGHGLSGYALILRSCSS